MFRYETIFSYCRTTRINSIIDIVAVSHYHYFQAIAAVIQTSERDKVFPSTNVHVYMHLCMNKPTSFINAG